LITLRPAKISDLKTLLEFEQGVIEAERPMDRFLKKGAIYYYNIEELIVSKSIQFMVADDNGELVGSGYIRLEDSRHYHKNSRYGYLGFIFVKLSHRGQRIITLILESLKEWAVEKELKELRLDVYSDNVAALKSYERFGFTKSLVNMRMDI
jgi:RimJ/RimL family protein N-acetyltransferase